MINGDERPSGEDIQWQLHRLEEVWSEAHNDFRQKFAHYNQNNTIWTRDQLEKGRVAHHLALATAIVDHASDNQVAFTPGIHCDPVGDAAQHTPHPHPHPITQHRCQSNEEFRQRES